ncbi:hypothetical protein LJR130_003829 [Variovorax sp. LjRoot130]|uniref:hypothetical protein n=1 Tax=Variovorax sp. LjRoot130 TaxID=3342261 RepID=UPI003ECD0327
MFGSINSRAGAGRDTTRLSAALLMALLGPPPSAEATAAFNKANPLCDDPLCDACNLRRELVGEKPLQGAAASSVPPADDKVNAVPGSTYDAGGSCRPDLERSARDLVNQRHDDAGTTLHIKRAAAALVLEIKKVREQHKPGSAAWMATDAALEHAIAANTWALRAANK